MEGNLQVEKEKRKVEVEGGRKATIDFSSPEETLSFDDSSVHLLIEKLINFLS